MKLLHAQGMNYFGLSVVFNALMLSTVLYVSHQAFGGHLHVDELNSLLHSLDKAFKWGFTSVKYDIRELFELADDKFLKIRSCNAEHCLNCLLPAKRDLCSHAMHSRGHDFQLSQIDTTLFKNSFINRCLFNYL